MNESRAPDVDALIAAARADFASRLPAKIEVLAALIRSGSFVEARLAAHRLRGSAATYGFARIGTLSGLVEDALRKELSEGLPKEPVEAFVQEALELAVEARRSGA